VIGQQSGLPDRCIFCLEMLEITLI
jgi:hypothetical protein